MAGWMKDRVDPKFAEASVSLVRYNQPEFFLTNQRLVFVCFRNNQGGDLRWRYPLFDYNNRLVRSYLWDFRELRVRLTAFLGGLHGEFVIIHKGPVHSELARLREEKTHRVISTHLVVLFWTWNLYVHNCWHSWEYSRWQGKIYNERDASVDLRDTGWTDISAGAAGPSLYAHGAYSGCHSSRSKLYSEQLMHAPGACKKAIWKSDLAHPNSIAFLSVLRPLSCASS